MSTALSTGLREYAVKRWPTMNHEWRKAKIASMLGMKTRRVRSFWDGEPTMCARVEEVAAISALLSMPQSTLDKGNRDAFADLQARIARLEAILLPQEARGDHPPMAGGGQGADSGCGEHVSIASGPRRRSTDRPDGGQAEG